MTIEHIRPGRFRNLLHPSNASSPWDTVLAETDDFVLAPTLGSIVPGWVLVIPKRSAISFVEVARTGVMTPYAYLHQAARLLGLSDDWIWFEHGPAFAGTTVGCGVDYAHLHILASPPFNFSEFCTHIEAAGGWTRCAAKDAYADLPSETPYYVAGCGNDAARLVGRELGSQFFRKAVASLSGDADRWDYRAHPFSEHVVATVDRFGALPVAAE